MGQISEGWQVAGITTLASGLPFDIFTAVDGAHTGSAQRPNYNSSVTLPPMAGPRTQTGRNLGLFANPPFGAGGNLMRNKFFDPGIDNWETILQKTTRISERMSVQFRVEAYNLFNRVQFNQPGNLTSDPGTFGQSTGEVTRADGTSGARQVRLGLKFSSETGRENRDEICAPDWRDLPYVFLRELDIGTRLESSWEFLNESRCKSGAEA